MEQPHTATPTEPAAPPRPGTAAAASTEGTAAVVVRTPAGVLHLLASGVTPPPLPVFTVPLLCCTDPEQAPAVRAYDGPWNGPKTCRVCLRVWRGDPAPQQAVLEELPGAEPIEPVERRVPALPREHRGRPLVWCDWQPQLVLSHYSTACEKCEDPGPGLMASGRGSEPPGRYVAFRCPACQHMTVYEHRGSWDLDLIYESRVPGRRR
ncbi:MAG TPA: hypothetical protein VN520_13485 [Streptomyces sp.]|uniref:hypothetical protein n=1 Tax=Streptomyces sp. TaxID=1931 RepID=UPI002BF9BB68|nr:hypothetical protein [Streptomyces sp.]HWU07368.1 hypothetical protein [Streptomyces sp.]